MDKSLGSYFLNNNGKIIHKWIHYFEIYEKYFQKYINCDVTMIEIGVDGGGSIDMWKNYFGLNSKIIGIDINPDCKKFDNPDSNIFIEIGDQSDEHFLESVLEKHGRPDIVLDDGSHIMHHLIKTFEYLYRNMKSEGIYMVEDLHTCYWPEYEGGFRLPNTFIEFSKGKIDELYASYTRGAFNETDFTKSTQSICIYDSIIVFEKRKQGRKFHTKTGDMSLLTQPIVGW